jgi:hypothetical protein
LASQLTLSLMMGLFSPSPVPRSVMEALTEVSVTSGGPGSPGSFSLNFATSKASEITTDLLPSGFFDPPTRVIISATLNGATTVLMDGVITTQDVVPSDEAGKSTLSIKGDDLTRMMDLIDFSSLIPYPAMPFEARVALIVAKYSVLYGIVPLVIPSVMLFVKNPLDSIDEQVGTDLAYLNMMAQRAGYVFYLQPGPEPGMSMAYWGPKLQAMIPFLPTPTPFAIDWDGRSNVESLQFSFDGFKKTLFYVMVKIGDIPAPLPIPVPDITPLSPPLGAKLPIPLKVTEITGLSPYQPIEAAAIALAKAADAADVISGRGTLDVLRYGSILNPRTVVQVQGAGITYDGSYYVQSVTHTIRPGSYKQNFSLVRNALVAQGAGAVAPLSAGGAAQQLPGLPTAPAPAPQGPVPVPTPPPPSPPLPSPAASGALPPVPPGSPPVPPAAGGSVVSSLPASPTG